MTDSKIALMGLTKLRDLLQEVRLGCMQGQGTFGAPCDGRCVVAVGVNCFARQVGGQKGQR